LHDSAASNPQSVGGPPGGVEIAADGSFAALVPASRALSWELTDPKKQSVVRERYWLTFKPGEIRVCTSCHGLNRVDQANQEAPNNTPIALKNLLNYLKNYVGNAPKYKVTFSSINPEQNNRNIFYAQDKASIKISGINDSAASKALDINLKVGNISCATPVLHLVTSADGSGSFKGVLPRLSGVKLPPVIPIIIQLSFNQKIVARTQFRLRSSNGRSNQSSISPTQLERLCRSLENFR